MCGLAAIFNYRRSSTVSIENLDQMNQTMIHRGPDAEGLWLNNDKYVGLAHRRLSIIDLSEKGAQPMHSEDKNLSIVFNGEIYNYQTLRVDLEKEGVKFFSNSDTEVLLHLYNKYDKQMVHHLRGMFAFAIWDEKRKGMFLARDPYGIKPLYYANTEKAFAAASQVKALLKWEQVNTEPEPAGHCGYFLLGSVPEPYTLFKGIRSLRAGHHLWVERDNEIEETEYASLKDIISNKQNDCDQCSDNEFRKIITDSIKHHLIADVEVGVFLSAGLDSTTITALSSEFQSSVRSLTLGFEEYRNTENDETILAEEVAKKYATTHHTEWVSAADFSEEYENLMRAMDQPSIDGVNTYFVSKITAESGLKVALSGIGGDELFGGYPSFQQIPKLVNGLGKIPFVTKFGITFRKITAPLMQNRVSPKYSGLFEFGDSYEGAYLLRRGLFMPWELPGILGYEMAKSGLEDLQILNEMRHSIDGLDSAHSKLTTLESSWYMKNQLLRDADWAGMAHSLEIRVPLVDWQLMKNFAPYLHCKDLNKKKMAQTPKIPLPNAVLNREKTGFRIPVEDWLTNGKEEVSGNSRMWAKKVYNEYLNYC